MVSLPASAAGGWAWYEGIGFRDAPERVTIEVDSAGTHAVDLWMREDGFRVDQLVLTTDPLWRPSGRGPASSPRGIGSRHAPVVTAGADADITLGENLALSGAATDADGDTLSLAWSAQPPAGVTFADAGSASTSVSFTAAGSYTLTLSASDGLDRVSDSLVVNVANSNAGFAAFINFQPGGAAVPNGYLADRSQPFADRGEHSYGWTSRFDDTRDRNHGGANDQRWDTLNHLQKGGVDRVWEIAVPPGIYRVRIVAGDPAYTDQRNHFDLEGVKVADQDGMDHFDDRTVEVSVTDGRLTLAPANDAVNAKINFIEITAATASN
ncbi:MAG: PKD domain-containing protein [Planctomycetota bacterium]|jgi:hypothetical protein|nr:PKD domain-containing protein [Planctomycetota bacterium]